MRAGPYCRLTTTDAVGRRDHWRFADAAAAGRAIGPCARPSEPRESNVGQMTDTDGGLWDPESAPPVFNQQGRAARLHAPGRRPVAWEDRRRGRCAVPP